MKFTPEAVNFTTASLALGSGTGNSTSSITSGPPVCLTCMAFIGFWILHAEGVFRRCCDSATKTLSFRSRRRGICCRLQCNAAGKKQIPKRLTPFRNDKTTDGRLGNDTTTCRVAGRGRYSLLLPLRRPVLNHRQRQGARGAGGNVQHALAIT